MRRTLVANMAQLRRALARASVVCMRMFVTVTVVPVTVKVGVMTDYPSPYAPPICRYSTHRACGGVWSQRQTHCLRVHSPASVLAK